MGPVDRMATDDDETVTRAGMLPAVRLAPLVVSVSLAALAGAQEGAHQLERFEPRPPGAGLLGVATPAELPPLGFGLAAWASYAVEPLVLAPTDSDDPRPEGAVVADRLRLELVGSLGLLDGLQVGAAAPFSRSLESGEYAFAGRVSRDFESWVPGDVRLYLDVAPLRLLLGLEHLLGLSVGAGVTAWAPTGDELALEGEGAFRVQPHLTARYDLLGLVSVAADVGYHARPEERLFTLGVDDELRWGLAADLWLPFGVGATAAAFGSLSTAGRRDPDDLDRTLEGRGGDPAEAQLALRWSPFDTFTLRVGAGTALTAGVGVPSWRGFAMLGLRWPGPRGPEGRGMEPDADRDGVPDGPDVCPHEPENIDGIRDEDGCPEAQPTQVAARVDGGPVGPEPEAEPKPLPALARPPDTDEDGLTDDIDACPKAPEDADGYQDSDGCPDLDDDRDGVPDAADECPRQAEIPNGVADGDGCPDVGDDADGDGVEDRIDVCPYEPEDKDGVRDGDGCPDAALVAFGAGAPAAVGGTAPPPSAPREGAPSQELPPLPVASDLDGDGIAAFEDACPKAAEDRDGYQDADGCPDPDDDGDGVLDAEDRCPRIAENPNGFEDLDGCPDTGPDGDGDGVGDADDVCPELAGQVEADGCPVADATDGPKLRPPPLGDLDGDGLWGDDDRCPRAAEDVDGFRDADGCPDPDDDGDGVPDVRDRCPRVAETPNGYQDADGCPDRRRRRRRRRGAR